MQYLATLSGSGRQLLVESNKPLTQEQIIEYALQKMQDEITRAGPAGLLNLGSANCISTAALNSTHPISGSVTLGTPPFTYSYSIKRPDNTYDPVTATWTGTGPYNYTFAQEGSYILTLNISDSCASAPKTDVASCTVTVTAAGSISCTTIPTGASVYLDGILQIGSTPTTLTNVPTGSHQVTFTKSGYNNCTQSVTVTANSMVSADCTLTAVMTTGSISCSTTPTGASIYLDGNLQIGLTPVTLTNIPTGSHQVKFTKSGYSDCTQSVTVTESATVSAICTLTAVTPPLTTSAVASKSPAPVIIGVLVLGFLGIVILKKKK